MSDQAKKRPGRPQAPDSKGAGSENEFLEGLKRKAREVVYQTPEVRPEKVARLKEAVEQGTYEIDAEKLAEIISEELTGKR